MAIMFLIVLGITGCFITHILEKNNLINYSKLNILEYISLNFFLGILTYIAYIILIGFFKIEMSYYVLIPFIIVDILSIILIIRNYKRIKFQKIEFNKLDIIPIVLIILLFIIYYFQAFSHNLQYPDEYAVWALNAKNYFLGHSLSFGINTGLETYPPLLPILYSGNYLMINKVSEHTIRVIPSLITFMGLIGYIGLTSKKGISISKSLYAILFIFLAYTSIDTFMNSTYGDLPFAILYTLGTIYFVEMIFTNDNNLNTTIVSIIYYNLCSLTKQDCTYMLTFNIFILMLIYIFRKKINIGLKFSLKKVVTVTCCLMISTIIWKAFCIYAGYPKLIVLGSESGFGIKYLSLLISNMNQQMFSNIPLIVMIIISILLLIKNISFKSKDEKNNSLYLIIITGFIVLTPAFMLVCYLFKFGAEAATAASYIRYLTRIIFILNYLVLILFNVNNNKHLLS